LRQPGGRRRTGVGDLARLVPPAVGPGGGGGWLCNFQGLRKPTWFAHSFLHRLGSEELVNDDAQSWVCREDDRVQALIYDHSFPEQDAHDQEYFIRDVPASATEGVELRLAGLAVSA